MDSAARFSLVYSRANYFYFGNFDNRPSRNRTYIGNLEGFCPNPLDDRPFVISKLKLISNPKVRN